jgi:hypothetical protein
MNEIESFGGSKVITIHTGISVPPAQSLERGA